MLTDIERVDHSIAMCQIALLVQMICDAADMSDADAFELITMSHEEATRRVAEVLTTMNGRLN